jgi:hypothetical protein
MVLKTPIFLENDTTTQNADELRLERSYMTMGRGGVHHIGGGFAVGQRGAGANMSVDVNAGGAAVIGTENGLQGTYHVTNDATVNVVVPAADLTNPRKDLVIVNVRDSFYSGANNDAQISYITGTPAASPVEPNPVALGTKNYMVLAMIDVPANDTAITTGQITDRRIYVSTPGGMILCTSATRPAFPIYGQMINETDTQRVYRWDGAAWKGTAFGKRPFVEAWRNAALSINNNTITTIDFDSEFTDSFGMHASGLFTVPTGWDGAWSIAAGMGWTSTATGRRICYCTVNASAFEIPIVSTGPIATSSPIPGSTILQLSGGDVVRIRFYQDSGTNPLALSTGSAYTNYARMTWIGAV